MYKSGYYYEELIYEAFEVNDITLSDVEINNDTLCQYAIGRIQITNKQLVKNKELKQLLYTNIENYIDDNFTSLCDIDVSIIGSLIEIEITMNLETKSSYYVECSEVVKNILNIIDTTIQQYETQDVSYTISHPSNEYFQKNDGMVITL
ncbi:hypothetical protein DEFDS_P215 (plasmid) [Deferribacter desulfuricans SSM1]|uniref:Uncharacterized protein n=1 Tax=Deferribacter desulfuricans (strain DSM 14783 / JCM 11476 / NBRC 101012 / SSM1) TaxID=639282 RepID=D3PF43_DEFDS|nr:hypothetical protein [Deferribacter desulfuricans]BAI81835.1 hypothetical protein DEFDS_P215 [Deferribacter desulfuricans SSM1]